ncbi:ImpA family type VI secretion system protein [Methylobacterium sp. J-090]|uniref:type VI secretion system protein TssA n=1 Tax=Methylobacterium sp. J-090 TaxID=2836666 RepID=UPI001FBBB7BA|nr:type VI secretion system ImpA family N-terminal domain-containing protein [Methylobacterium sp. J-090]MCJ2081712.1 type VI secretion system ImpA family N-terminal domain-containing protein [Methylobacterium sp. J-090]
MATDDAARLSAPISADAPCGPDLDAEGDPEYLQCVAFVEGLLPLSFFTRDDEGRQQVFDRASIDIPGALTRVVALLDATRDLRLLTLLGRLHALNRDLGGLAEALTVSAALLRAAWADVHPRGEGADFSFRTAVLQTFDDMPTVVLPVQHIALCENRRHGPISFRTVMVAHGEAAAREGEPPVDRAALDRAFAEADLDALQATAARLAAIETAAAAIRETCVANAGYDQALSLTRLSTLVGRALALVRPAIQARTGVVPGAAAAGPDGPDGPAGSAETAGGPPAGAVRAGRITGVRDASAALAAAASYLRRSEPSSPAELLTRQAQMLVGKSFLDVMSILIPDHAAAAVIAIGAGSPLRLSFGQLEAVPREDGADSDPESEAGAPDAESEAGTERVRAATRAEAVALLVEVGQFYRSAEPSSPIPLLLDRATGLIERDFLSILRDVLPDLALGADGS